MHQPKLNSFSLFHYFLFPSSFLQSIKNSAITVQVPLLRETIAQLVYKVKGALAANKCSSAFWMGNLKNKNIYGEEILSQTTSITGSNLTAVDDDGEGDGEGDEENELLENSMDDVENGGSRTRRSKRQSNRESASKGKKRKLYRSKNDTVDNGDDEDSSRSRCF